MPNIISGLCYILIATLVACLGSWWHIIVVAILLGVSESSIRDEYKEKK